MPNNYYFRPAFCNQWYAMANICNKTHVIKVMVEAAKFKNYSIQDSNCTDFPI